MCLLLWQRFDIIWNNRWRKPKGQSRMDHPEKQAALETRLGTNTNKTKKTQHRKLKDKPHGPTKKLGWGGWIQLFRKGKLFLFLKRQHIFMIIQWCDNIVYYFNTMMYMYIYVCIKIQDKFKIKYFDVFWAWKQGTQKIQNFHWQITLIILCFEYVKFFLLVSLITAKCSDMFYV